MINQSIAAIAMQNLIFWNMIKLSNKLFVEIQIQMNKSVV